jgi:threonylcarbamoyladenosine tRNA methylthiotransferase MtaB
MRVFFTNLGCKLNQAENDRLAGQFLTAGHQLAGSLAEADLHVINSCTVTANAARTSRKAARAGARAAAAAGAGDGGGGGRQLGDAAPPLRTVLTGCYATASPEEAAGLAGVDLVIANADKDRLVERVTSSFSQASQAPSGVGDLTGVRLIPGRALPPLFPPPSPGNTRALVKVEDGCDMGCSFCIIPRTRGSQRSRPAAEVVAEVRGLLAAGYREIVVTGVQISAWRGRLDRTQDRGHRHAGRLADLVRQLLATLPAVSAAPAVTAAMVGAAAPAGAAPAARLRLTSIAPWQLTGELLELWADPRLCRHLHLSLQSGATATLRRMRRPYTAESYARKVETVRSSIPGVAVTTDVIVGFPGESDAEFAESLATVARLGFAKVHVFPFSSRPGTAAAALPGVVAPALLRQRMGRMQEVAERSARAFQEAQLGCRATVLWEGPQAGRGQGLTDNYVRVFSPQAEHRWNQLTEVELLAVTDGGVTGRLIPAG